MKTTIVIVLAMATVSGCGSHKGAIKPNGALADFDKYGEAYYLSLDQIAIGDSKAKTVEEYGDKYQVKKLDNNREQWIFESYRATFARDPVDKLIYVEFSNGKVVDKYEIKPGQSAQVPARQASPIEQIQQLDRLRNDGIITEEEFQAKKKKLLEKI